MGYIEAPLAGDAGDWWHVVDWDRERSNSYLESDEPVDRVHELVLGLRDALSSYEVDGVVSSFAARDIRDRLDRLDWELRGVR